MNIKEMMEANRMRNLRNFDEKNKLKEFRVLKNRESSSGKIEIKYEKGYFYCPYVPLQITGVDVPKTEYNHTMAYDRAMALVREII